MQFSRRKRLYAIAVLSRACCVFSIRPRIVFWLLLQGCRHQSYNWRIGWKNTLFFVPWKLNRIIFPFIWIYFGTQLLTFVPFGCSLFIYMPVCCFVWLSVLRFVFLLWQEKNWFKEKPRQKYVIWKIQSKSTPYFQNFHFEICVWKYHPGGYQNLADYFWKSAKNQVKISKISVLKISF